MTSMGIIETIMFVLLMIGLFTVIKSICNIYKKRNYVAHGLTTREWILFNIAWDNAELYKFDKMMDKLKET